MNGTLRWLPRRRATSGCTRASCAATAATSSCARRAHACTTSTALASPRSVAADGALRRLCLHRRVDWVVADVCRQALSGVQGCIANPNAEEAATAGGSGPRSGTSRCDRETVPVSASRVSHCELASPPGVADARVAGTSCPLWARSSLARGSSSISAQRRRLRCASNRDLLEVTQQRCAVVICACAVCLCSWKEGILRGSEMFPRGNAC